jgi:hypothetical protein
MQLVGARRSAASSALASRDFDAIAKAPARNKLKT